MNMKAIGLMVLACAAIVAANAREIIVKDNVTGKPTAWMKPADKTPAVMIAPVGSVGVMIDAPKLWANFKRACEPKFVTYAYYERVNQFEAGQQYAAAGMLDAGPQTVKGEGVMEVKRGYMAMIGETVSEHPWLSATTVAAVVGGVALAYQQGWFGLGGSSDSKAAATSTPALPSTSVQGNGNTVSQVIVIQQTAGGAPVVVATPAAPAAAPAEAPAATPAL